MFMHDVVKPVDDLLGVMNGYSNQGYIDPVLRANEDANNRALIAENLRLVDLLESHRCPSPFYKKGILKLI
jgi:hypothetical protein